MRTVTRSHQRAGGRDDSVRADVLAAAVRDGRPAILSRCLDGQTERNYTCFLRGDADHQRLHLALPGRTRATDSPDLRAGETVGVSFRGNRRKYFFTGVVEGVERTARACDDDVVIVRWPDTISRMQRRLHERSTPPTGERIDVCFGDGGSAGGILEDLSVGGFRVRTRFGDDLASGDLTTCLLSQRDSVSALSLKARLRHIEHDADGMSSLGFEFAELESTAEGRCRMAHLAATAARFRQSNTAR